MPRSGTVSPAAHRHFPTPTVRDSWIKRAISRQLCAASGRAVPIPHAAPGHATRTLQIGDHATMQLPDSPSPDALDEAALDRLLRALGDATRRRLLDRLRDAPGLTLSALGDGIALSRQAVSKHLAVLAAADLVVTVWRGREKLHYLNPVPLEALPTRWVTTSARAHSAALLALQQALAVDPG